MLRTTPARSRERTRRTLLAAALPTVIAATALASAAEAATVAVNPRTPVLGYSAAPGETNQVFIRVDGDKLRISDNTAPLTAGNGCTLTPFGSVECPIAVDFIGIQLGDKNDRVEYAAPHEGFVGGQDGNDLFLGAIRRAAPGRAIAPVFYDGDAGIDTIDYQFADRGVRVDTADNPSNQPSLAADGRPGDLEDVDEDIETIQGSNFADVLFGSAGNDLLRGLDGDDTIGGGAGADVIDEGSAPNGADFLNGGDGPNDRVTYGARTSGVTVSLDGVRNDGATGEQDDVRQSVERLSGTNFNDTLSGNGLANSIDARAGNDTVNGHGGDDTLSVGAGNNGVVGGTGNDVIFARNGAIDNIDCGDNTDTDTADRDTSENRVIGCERGQVGVLRLTPASVRAEAGKPVRLRLSWRHPRAWKQLRTIELRLSHDGRPVGEITIRPRRGQITGGGGVKLVRRGTRLTRDGRTVTARLALRLDTSLAGRTLKAEVEATDRHGRRQLQRDATTVRLTP